MKLNFKQARVIPLLAALMFVGGAITIRAEKDVSSVVWPIRVDLSHMEFGDVYSGEKVEKNFQVSYSGSGDGSYSITEKYKPKPGVSVPSGFVGTISDYCQVNHDDFERCYRNLCPFIDEISREGEGDTVAKAAVSTSDHTDVWAVLLNTPFVGELSQDGKGGVVSVGGEYGCDLSFNVGSLPSDPVCGNGTVESGEQCDDGNNKDGDGCSHSCQMETCDKSSSNFSQIDKADIGNEDSEASHNLDGWRAADASGSFRQVIECPCSDDQRTAQVTMHSGSQAVNSLTLRFLDRSDQPDSFEVYAGSQRIAQWSDMGEASDDVWVENTFNVSAYNLKGDIQLTIKATDPIVESCHQYGQLAIDWISINACAAPPAPQKGSISGCKYDDKNANGKIDCGEEKMSGWEMQLVRCPYAPLSSSDLTWLDKGTINTNPAPGLTGYCSVVASTTTGADGCYQFNSLPAGDYGVNEAGKNYWTQTSPQTGKYYYFKLAAGENKQAIDFLNHQEEVPVSICGNGKVEGREECDDGNKNNFDGCSDTCKKETPVCGNGHVESGETCDDSNTKSGDGCSASCTTESHGGGGGGVIYIPLTITNEKVQDYGETNATFTWLTNLKADSRVVCGLKSIAKGDLKSDPDYGYDFSTATFDTDNKLTSHSVSMFGLSADTAYYCRVISTASSRKAISTELTFRTKKPNVVVVPPTTPTLFIYNLTLQGLQKTSVALKWNTNRNGTTCVNYAKTSRPLGSKPSYGYDWKTGGCENLGAQDISHGITIGGLEPCTTYYFRLTSTNGSLDAVTEEQQVKTVCQTKSTYYPRTYVPAVAKKVTVQPPAVPAVEETGEVAAAQTDKEECPACEVCKQCEVCSDTVKTVVEKERYMSYEDWLILLIILVILTLLINALRGRRKKKEGALMGGDQNMQDDIDNIDNEETV